MKLKSTLVFLLFLLTATVSFSQNKFTLSGVVTNTNTSETLIGVSVIVKEAGVSTMTNEYGFYSVSLAPGDYSLEVSSIGYSFFTDSISLTQNTRKNIALQASDILIEEVVITGNTRAINIRKPEMSVSKLSVEEIKKTPVVLGEVDILKSILNLPGVTNAGEGASGFNVRGGAADQNLVLLDEATLYSSSHLFGFFSVFFTFFFI